MTLLGYSPPIRVTPLSGAAVRERFGLGDGPFVLMVGTRKPHKNVEGLLRGFAEVRAATPAARLVLAGNPTGLEPSLLALARELGLSESVHFLGFVEADELEGLYAAAECFVLPSYNEGFGLPVLEALGRGIAVACSSAASLPEVGGEAALYFDPGRPAEIAGAITRLLAEPELRRELAQRGRRRAAELSWRACAEATLESYCRAVAQTTRLQ